MLGTFDGEIILSSLGSFANFDEYIPACGGLGSGGFV